MRTDKLIGKTVNIVASGFIIAGGAITVGVQLLCGLGLALARRLKAAVGSPAGLAG
jgi:hypothetical protein